jgi:hypothetical protein
MQRITVLGLALLASLAIVAVGAGSVSATSHEFIANKLGKTKGKNANTQVFMTGVGTIECTAASGTGEVKALASTTHKETITFSSCMGFGVPVKITAAHFEFNAEGSAKLEKRVTMTPEGLGCEVLIEPQTVSGITYSNGSGKITAEAEASNIVSKGTGHLCGGENTEGSYNGKVTGELESGTIEWK